MSTGAPKGSSPVMSAMRGRCPACGRGALYSGVLTVSDTCTSCGLDLREHDTGDGPAVFVIFTLGALLVPLAIFVETVFGPPVWVQALLWGVVTIGGSIFLLRVYKGALVGLQFKHLSLGE